MLWTSSGTPQDLLDAMLTPLIWEPLARPTSCREPRPSRLPDGQASATGVGACPLDPAGTPRDTATWPRCLFLSRRLDVERKRDDARRPAARRAIDPERAGERVDAILPTDASRAP